MFEKLLMTKNYYMIIIFNDNANIKFFNAIINFFET